MSPNIRPVYTGLKPGSHDNEGHVKWKFYHSLGKLCEWAEPNEVFQSLKCRVGLFCSMPPSEYCDTVHIISEGYIVTLPFCYMADLL